MGPSASVAGGGRPSRRRRLLLGLGAQALLSKVSQLPRGRHLEKSSTVRLKQQLLPTGLGHTRRGSGTTGMANTTHVGATPINE